MLQRGAFVRAGIYSFIICYLVLDLYVIDGPVSAWSRKKAAGNEDRKEQEVEKGGVVVARVYGEPITLEQVKAANEQQQWRMGLALQNEVSSKALCQRYRAVLEGLIDEALLKIKVKYNSLDYPVTEKEVESALVLFASRYGSKERFLEHVTQWGWDGEEEVRGRLAGRLQQDKYLKAMIPVEVSEEEARAYYEKYRKELAYPERRRARHIFLARLENSKEKAMQALLEAKVRLSEGGGSWVEVAVMSEDEASKTRGGDLGWMQRGRLPEDFAAFLFDMALNEVKLVETKLGWHLLEVTSIKQAEQRSFEEAKLEIISALEVQKRDKGLLLYRKQLRRFAGERVRRYPEKLCP